MENHGNILYTYVVYSVSARGASCRHLTPLFSSGCPELEPRASKNMNNSREDREFLSLEITKRKKDKDIHLLEGQRSLVGFFSEY